MARPDTEPRVPEAVLDWAPVLVVALVGQLDFALAQPWTASDVTRGLLAVLVALPLGWRRRAPRVVAAAVMGILLGQAVLVDPALPFGAFLAVLVVAYGLAKHTRGRDSLVGAGIVVAGVAAVTWRMGWDSPVEVVFPVVYLGGTWLLGRGMRIREERTSQLRDLALQLEAERDQRARLAVADERARIARELHDILAHTVSTIVVQAEAADEVFDTDPAGARRRLRAIQAAGREGLAELRRMLGMLRSDEGVGDRADPQPGFSELGALVDRMRQAGLDVRLHRDGALASLPAGVQLSAYRIVQEALTNTLRHAGPVPVEVDIRLDGGAVQVRVADQGDRRSGKGSRDGQGLVGMRERAALFGGRVEAGFGEGGFVVSAVLPVEEPAR